MNKCRKCGVIIPDRFNGWQALWCSWCRAEHDKEIGDIIAECDYVWAENQNLRNTNFVMREEFKKLKRRYDMLRQQYTVVLNDNDRLMNKLQRILERNERLRDLLHRYWIKDE